MTFLRKVQAPLLFLAVSVLAFGVQIPWLGFYLDDWVILQAYNMRGIRGLFVYAFDDDRPLVFWTWALSLKLLGSSPAGLQAWTLMFRWLSVVVLWAGWRRLWPQHATQVTLAALLFAVYPLFIQQSSSLAFGFHWICLFLYGLSLVWMIISIETGRRYGLWTVLALLASAVQLLTSEYFLGLELLRPVVLWLALRTRLPDRRVRAGKVLQIWIPYLLVLGGYLVWRFHIMPVSGEDRNTLWLLLELRQQPLNGLAKLAEMFFQDLSELFVGAWYRTMQPSLFTIRPPANLIAWAAAGLTACLLAVFFLRRPAQQQSDPPGEAWYRSAIPFGFIALLAGLLPGWAVGHHIFAPTSAYNDRFGLAAMFGAALLLVGLLEMLSKERWHWVALTCLLVGLGVGHQMRVTTNYRWSWEKQRQLFWQLKWRAPALPAPTAILGDGPLMSYMGTWTLTSAFLQMYAPHDPDFEASYWYFDMQKINVSSNIATDGLLDERRKFLSYSDLAHKSLVIHFQPEEGHCLWVLSSRDEDNNAISENIRAALPFSQTERIQSQPDIPLRADIFGSEIPRTWCYYFQKADLARDQGNWPGVMRLWREADRLGFHSPAGVEYAPFIEGAAHTTDWALAYELSGRALSLENNMRAYVCRTWQRISTETDASPEKAAALARVRSDFGCTGNLTP